MNDRYTADTITSDALDALYDRLDRARDAAALHRQGLITTAELYAVIEAAPAATEPCAGRVCAGTGCSHERAATALIAHDQAAGHYQPEEQPRV